MRNHIKYLLALACLASATLASAAPVPGTGGGYFGSAWFTNNHGIVVGAYPTWGECNYYFQQSLNKRVNDWGWTVSEINPCSYRPPYGSIHAQHELALPVDTSSPDASLEEVNRILDELREVRDTFRADEYDAALERIR